MKVYVLSRTYVIIKSGFRKERVLNIELCKENARLEAIKHIYNDIENVGTMEAIKNEIYNLRGLEFFNENYEGEYVTTDDSRFKIENRYYMTEYRIEEMEVM